MSSSRQFSPAAHPDICCRRPAGSMLDTVPEVHLLDRLAVVFKHLRLIGAVFAIVVSIAMLESYSATPLYRSLARIVIQDERIDGDRHAQFDRPGLLAGSGTVLQHPVSAFCRAAASPAACSRRCRRRRRRSRAPSPVRCRCRGSCSTAGAARRCATDGEAPARDESADGERGDRRVPRRARDRPGQGHAARRDRLLVARSLTTPR